MAAGALIYIGDALLLPLSSRTITLCSSQTAFSVPDELSSDPGGVLACTCSAPNSSVSGLLCLSTNTGLWLWFGEIS